VWWSQAPLRTKGGLRVFVHRLGITRLRDSYIELSVGRTSGSGHLMVACSRLWQFWFTQPSAGTTNARARTMAFSGRIIEEIDDPARSGDDLGSSVRPSLTRTRSTLWNRKGVCAMTAR